MLGIPRNSKEYLGILRNIFPRNLSELRSEAQRRGRKKRRYEVDLVDYRLHTFRPAGIIASILYAFTVYQRILPEDLREFLEI